MRARGPLRGTLALLLLGWAAVSLAQLPPLDRPLREEASHLWLRAIATVGVALYAVAAVRYYRLYRRRPTVMLLSVITAFALLAEALVALALARNWHASWWEWHLLLAFAFAFVAYSAYVQYRREGGTGGLFHGIYLDETIQRLQILSYGAGAHPAMVGTFSILRFADGELPDVVYLEHLTKISGRKPRRSRRG